MHARSTVETLGGARLEKADANSWHGFFIGNVGIESVDEDAEAVRFDVVVPTASSDIEDFIWSRERETGTTEKIVLTQAGREVPGARIVGIGREGPDARWSPSPTDQYRLTFEVDIVGLRPDQPLGLLTQPTDADEWTEVARATGS